jgi:site-specific recombinase XerD
MGTQIMGNDLAGRLPERAPEEAATAARDDAGAASLWLAAKGSRSANTFASYRREAARLLLWLAERRLTLAKMKVEHAHLYFAHLAEPPAHWVRPRKPRRGQRLLPTQALSGPLSASSIGYARTVLGQMCAYLQEAGYVRRNVFRLSAMPPAAAAGAEPSRFLDLECWGWLWQWLCALPCGKPAEAAHAARARWLFALLYHTGVRREEAAQGRMGNFIRRDRAWLLRTVGKGEKERLVTVNSCLLGEMARYRLSLGLPAHPSPDEDFPLVAPLSGARRRRPLTPRAVGKIVGALAKRAACQCGDAHCRSQQRRDDAERLARLISPA